MAKRFTDNEKWQDNWFTDLTNDQKIIWIYLLDHCDNAGLWKVNMKNLNYFCSTNISVEDVISTFNSRLTKIKEDLFFINKFCSFQYGLDFLNSKNKAVVSAINKLIQLGIVKDDNGTYTLSIPYQYPIDSLSENQDTPKEKEKEEEQVKVKSKVIETEIDKRNKKLIEIFKYEIKEKKLTKEQVIGIDNDLLRKELNLYFNEKYPEWEKDLKKNDANRFCVNLEKQFQFDNFRIATIKAYKLLNN
jgi:hypothetical protein